MKIGVVGGGSLGTAIALRVSLNTEFRVCIWNRDILVVDDINNKRQNSKYLPYCDIKSNIRATSYMEEVLDSDFIFLVVKTEAIREVLSKISNIGVSKNVKFIICNKGIEKETLNLSSQIFEFFLPNNVYGIMSGPNFADEIAKGKFCVSTLASKFNEMNIDFLDGFFIKKTSDLIGVQVFGAGKNCIAIANGIACGLDLGKNAQSMIFYYGVKELYNIALKLGAKKETILEPCGFADIHLTCSNLKSRNMSFGFNLSRNVKVKDLAEGVGTSESLTSIAHDNSVDMPICEFVRDVVSGVKVAKNILEVLY